MNLRQLLLSIVLGVIGLSVIIGSCVGSLYRADFALEQNNYDAEIPALYPGVQWGPGKRGRYSFTSFDGKGGVAAEGYHVTSEPLDYFPHDLVRYYEEELKARGWVRVSGGESHVAIYRSYAKDDRNNLIRILGHRMAEVTLNERYFYFNVRFPDGIVHQGYRANVEYSFPD